jgi:hypothetical protein
MVQNHRASIALCAEQQSVIKFIDINVMNLSHTHRHLTLISNNLPNLPNERSLFTSMFEP